MEYNVFNYYIINCSLIIILYSVNYLYRLNLETFNLIVSIAVAVRSVHKPHIARVYLELRS